MVVALDIVKVTAWRVPPQAEREERWDAEVVRESGSHERVTGIPKDSMDRLFETIAEILKKRPPLKTRTR